MIALFLRYLLFYWFLEALGKVTVTIFLTTQMKLFRYSSPNQLKSKELSVINHYKSTFIFVL